MLKNKWNEKFLKNPIFYNILLLASGSSIGKVLGIIAMPIITRLYLPEHFGILSIFVATTGLLSPFGTLLYSAAIPLPLDGKTGINLAALCFVILSVCSLLVTLILYFFGETIFIHLSIQPLLPYWWLLIIATIGVGSYEILSAWAIRERNFKALAKTSLSQSISGSLAKIGLGILGLKPSGLLIGHILTQAGGINSLAMTFAQQFRANFKYISKNQLFFLLKEYIDYPIFRLPSQFLLIFSTQAPLFFSTFLFGTETTGQVGLAITTLALPINIIGQSVGKAYYGEISRIGKKKPSEIYELTKKTIKHLLLVSLFPFIILLFGGPLLFEIAFGDQWHDAGEFASVLSVYLVFQFISSPLVNVLNVFEKQGLFLKINIARFILTLFVFGVSFTFCFSANRMIGLYSLVLSLHYFLTSLLILTTIRKSIR
jgi:O-antigen/teichoic acid export membrane protein